MESHALTLPPKNQISPALPELRQAVVQAGGNSAGFVWDEFFLATLRNPHTRAAYGRAIGRLLTWLTERDVPLTQTAPGMIGAYLDELGGSIPSKKLALAAIRRFFDALTLRHVVAFNPALSVRGERYSINEGKTPAIPIDQSRTLLSSIDVRTPAGLRDRAVLATLIYTALRASAAANLRLKDLVHDGTQYALRFTEKGGKDRNLPVRHDLERYLLEYLAVAVKDGEPKTTPLFRTLTGRAGMFTSNAMTGTDIWRMTKRRLKDAELPGLFSPHSFRAATCTDLLEQGLPLADVQFLLGHADPRTTRLYDRRHQVVSRNLVERISI
jgi:integrase/recombinase XerD